MQMRCQCPNAKHKMSLDLVSFKDEIEFSPMRLCARGLVNFPLRLKGRTEAPEGIKRKDAWR